MSFLARAVDAAKCVCRIELQRHEGGRPVFVRGEPAITAGTGWLIGRRFVMTNFHVVSARRPGEAPGEGDLAEQMRTARISFDYDDSTTVLGGGVPHAGLRASNAKLDYAIIELSRDLGIAPLRLHEEALAIVPDDRFAVNIIQHPGGAHKQIAIRNNLAVGIRGGELIYYTDTDKGSSGSPVCDDRWRVVALHKASTMKFGNFNYQGKNTAWINYGTPIKRIIDDLRDDAALWNDIALELV